MTRHKPVMDYVRRQTKSPAGEACWWLLIGVSLTYRFDADHRGLAHGHGIVIFTSSLISSMLEMTTGVRVDLAFASNTARSNSMMVSPRLTC